MARLIRADRLLGEKRRSCDESMGSSGEVFEMSEGKGLAYILVSSGLECTLGHTWDVKVVSKSCYPSETFKK